jgi:hypothetical protein
MSHMDSTRVGCGSNTIQNIWEASSAVAAKDEDVSIRAGSWRTRILMRRESHVKGELTPEPLGIE